jgi:VCBS repeat-containing protein
MYYKPGTTAPTCPTGQYAVVIGSPNHAPSAVGDSYSTAEDTTLNVSTPGVLSNDSDPDGDTMTAQLATGPSHGTLTLNSDGSFSYTPAANYNGTDSLTYKASDGKGGEATATVSITVNAVNDAPVANNDSATVDAGVTVGVDVLANDTDVDNTNAQLSVSSFTQPANGAVTKNADGTLDYTPNAGYNGTDSFTYKASDGTAESNEATVTITVNSPDAQCRTLASKTLGSSFNPDNYTFHGGTAADDTFTGTDGQSEVFCGFGGNDSIGTLQAGDIFLGGDGNDTVTTNNGTFYGDAGNDYVHYNRRTFNGGAGDDSVYENYWEVNGGDGNDSVTDTNYGTFNGGAGDDYVNWNEGGTFNGGDGNDSVTYNYGTFVQ